MLLRSIDVLHDFYVPEFRAKMDMIPGSVTYFWFTPTRTGTFEVLCAELCGQGHPLMRGAVVVDTEQDYLAWLGAAADIRATDGAPANGRGGPASSETTPPGCLKTARQGSKRSGPAEKRTEVFLWSMSRLASRCHPAGRSRGSRTLPSAQLVDEIRLLAGRQGHRHPVFGGTAIAIGLVALVLSWLMRLQLGFPGTFSFITPEAYYQFITMHGMIMVIYLLTALFLGGFGNYLIPLMVGARDMVFPYVNMLSYWIYLLAVLVLVASFFAPGGPTGAGWTLYPPQAILTGTPGGQDWGIILMLVSLILFIIGFTMGGLNYVVTVLQGRTRGMTLMRMPLTVWGIFTATVMALLAFPALFVACVMMLLDRAARHQLLHAGDRRDGRAAAAQWRQPDPVPAPVLVLRPPRGLHRRAAGLRHRLRPDQHPCAQEHLRLPHDGVGDRRHRRAELRGLGAPHVCQRHEPLFRLLLRHHDADHRHPDRDQGLQLGADAVARRHPSDHADAVRAGLHRHLRQWRADRPVPRQCRRRRAALGHHVRRRAFPHGDGRGADHW